MIKVMFNLQSNIGQGQLIVVILIQEGRVSGEEEEGEDTEGPDVGLGGDVLVLDHLRSHKLRGPHHGPHTLLGRESVRKYFQFHFPLPRSSAPETTRSR